MVERIILVGATQSQQARDTLFELGRTRQDFANVVLTMACTAHGYLGSSECVAFEDHIHPAQVAASVANVSLLTSTAGVAVTFPRGDHVHYVPLALATTACNVSWATSTAGVTTNVAREDHAHMLKLGTWATLARVASQTYTNAGSGPLWLFVSHCIGTTALTSYLYVGATVAAEAVHQTINATLQLATVVAPAGEYRLSSTASSVTVKAWVEYGF